MARVILSFEGDAAKSVAAQRKVITGLERQLAKTKSLNKASAQAERASVRASSAQRRQAGFGASAAQRATAAFSGGALVGQVAGQLRQLVATMEAEIKRAGQLIRETFTPLQDLIQISDTLLEFQQFRATGQRFAAKTGVRQPQGLGLTFDAQSLGLLKDLGEIGKVTGFADPSGFIQSISKLENVFGTAEIGTRREAANKLLFAAKESAVNVQQLVPAAIRPAAIASIIGASDEELLALIAVAVKGTKSPEQASTAIDALGRLINKNKLGGGRGFLAGLDALDALPAAERDKILGSDAEALKGVVIAGRGRAEIERVLKGTQLAQTLSGTELSEISKKRAIVETDPQVRLLRDARISAAREEITAAATRGTIDLEKQVLRDQLRVMQDFLGISVPARGFDKALLETSMFFGGRPDPSSFFLGRIPVGPGESQQDVTGRLVEEMIQRQITALDRNTAALENANAAPVLEP